MAESRKSAAGRKPWDEVVIFKALVLQALYNLSVQNLAHNMRRMAHLERTAARPA